MLLNAIDCAKMFQMLNAMAQPKTDSNPHTELILASQASCLALLIGWASVLVE